MATVQYSAPADLPADDAFTFMTSASDLAALLPGAKTVRTEHASRQFTWDDGGALRVLDRGANQCEIEISVDTERDAEQVRQELAEAVAALAHKASAARDEAEGEAHGPGGGWA
ncbi:hypothetical protein FHX82_000501 [Amycolatopsis bartoniae]|nr:hypothetical protein [Amycolatopsis bartoniae]MBB2933481.1 hypothetical protein [Amycolatopsis bartoniae]TVT07584.1 hypothetical protein FNH07_15560 [Amycolatopsis bartoniae]